MSQQKNSSDNKDKGQINTAKSVYGQVPKRFRKLNKSKSALILVALISGVFGVYLIFRSSAASPYASIEAEKGTLKIPATLQSNNDAGGGSYVRFGATTTPGDTHFGLPLIKKLYRTSDWNQLLKQAPGSSITDQPDGSIRLFQPGGGERTELTVYRPEDGGVPSHGYEAFYTWEFMIPPSTRLYNGHNTISQFHGNNQAGYTGGMVIDEDRPPERLILRVKGGTELNKQGSHRYEFESDRGAYAVPESQMASTPFQRGVWNKIEYHVLWTTQWNGYAYMRFNGGPWFGVKNVPTSSNVADVQMFRVGWYPGGDPVPPGGLEMFVRNTAVYGKPSN